MRSESGLGGEAVASHNLEKALLQVCGPLVTSMQWTRAGEASCSRGWS